MTWKTALSVLSRGRAAPVQEWPWGPRVPIPASPVRLRDGLQRWRNDDVSSQDTMPERESFTCIRSA